MRTNSGINILNENNNIFQDISLNNKYGKVWGYQGENVLYLKENESFVSFDSCLVAKPLFLSYRQLPLVGELILLFDLPSSDPVITNKKLETYYFPPINIWESSTHGSRIEGIDGYYKTQNLENGDTIYEGRFENFLLFKEYYTELKHQNSFFQIYNDKIYINSDKLKLNSKEVYINSKKTINLFSEDNIGINSVNSLKIDSKKILLGGDSQNILKGNDTILLLSELIKNLSIFASRISNTISTPPGSLLPHININSIMLSNQLIKLMDKLEKLLVKKVYV